MRAKRTGSDIKRAPSCSASGDTNHVHTGLVHGDAMGRLHKRINAILADFEESHPFPLWRCLLWECLRLEMLAGIIAGTLFYVVAGFQSHNRIANIVTGSMVLVSLSVTILIGIWTKYLEVTEPIRLLRQRTQQAMRLPTMMYVKATSPPHLSLVYTKRSSMWGFLPFNILVPGDIIKLSSPNEVPFRVSLLPKSKHKFSSAPSHPQNERGLPRDDSRDVKGTLFRVDECYAESQINRLLANAQPFYNWECTSTERTSDHFEWVDVLWRDNNHHTPPATAFRRKFFALRLLQLWVVSLFCIIAVATSLIQIIKENGDSSVLWLRLADKLGCLLIPVVPLAIAFWMELLDALGNALFLETHVEISRMAESDQAQSAERFDSNVDKQEKKGKPMPGRPHATKSKRFEGSISSDDESFDQDDQEVEEPVAQLNEFLNTIQVSFGSVLRRTRNIMVGNSRGYVTRGINPLQVLGSVTVFCCLDSDGILTENLASPDQIMVVEDGQPVILDVLRDPVSETGLVLEGDWEDHLSLLKPLGLNALLNNPCNIPISMQSSRMVWFEDVRGSCLCRLASTIGFEVDMIRERFRIQQIIHQHLKNKFESVIDPKSRLIDTVTEEKEDFRVRCVSTIAVDDKYIQGVGSPSVQLLGSGDPFTVLDNSQEFWVGHDVQIISDDLRTRIEAIIRQWYRQDMTIVAFSYSPVCPALTPLFNEEGKSFKKTVNFETVRPEGAPIPELLVQQPYYNRTSIDSSLSGGRRRSIAGVHKFKKEDDILTVHIDTPEENNIGDSSFSDTEPLSPPPPPPPIPASVPPPPESSMNDEQNLNCLIPPALMHSPPSPLALPPSIPIVTNLKTSSKAELIDPIGSTSYGPLTVQCEQHDCCDKSTCLLPMRRNGDNSSSTDQNDTWQDLYHRSVQRQVFLGLVTMRDAPKENLTRLVEQLMSAGIRFVYFSSDNERKTKAFGAKVGLFTDFNSCISLKDPSPNTLSLDGIEERKVEGAAQLPVGVSAIRDHVERVDNVPLLVSLFRDCTNVNSKEMVRIYQEHGDTVFCLGSSLVAHNSDVFAQSDISVSLNPLPSQYCPFDSHTKEDPNFQRKPYSKSREFAFSMALTSLPCVLSLDINTDPQHLSAVIVEGRRFYANYIQSLLFASCCYLQVFFAEFFGIVINLPPVLVGYQAFWLVVVIIPVLSVSLINSPREFSSLTQISGKNKLHSQMRLTHTIYFVCRCIPSVAVYLIVFVWFLDDELGSDFLDDHFFSEVDTSCLECDNAKYSDALLAAQNYAMLFYVFIMCFSSGGFISRSQSLFSVNPLKNGIWIAGVTVALFLQLCFLSVTNAVSSHGLSDLQDKGIWYIFFLWPLFILLVDELVKIYDRNKIRYTQNVRRASFETVLGQFSPKPASELPSGDNLHFYDLSDEISYAKSGEGHMASIPEDGEIPMKAMNGNVTEGTEPASTS